MNLGEMLRAKLMMADLRDAMELKPKVEEAEPAQRKRKGFQVTNNMNRIFFEHVKNNPGTRQQLIGEMVTRGFKKGSTTSLVQQMLRQGLLQKDDEGVLHLTVAEYTPVKASRTLKKLEEAKAKAEARERAKAKREERKKVVFVSKKTGLPFEAKRPVSPSPAVPMGIPSAPVSSVAGPIVRSTWNAQDAVAGLTVLQAKELYAELKKIFNGN